MADTDPTRVAVVCVKNAGRSQMATAFAERGRDRRGLTGDVELLSGGTEPADRVHEPTIAVMDEVGLDLADRTPRRVTAGELRSCDDIETMGCTGLDLPNDVDVREWDLTDPDGEGLERVRAIRDDVADRVRTLFDEIEEDRDT